MAGLWASGLSLTPTLSDEEVEAISPIMAAYQAVMKCKALGITIDASAFDLDTLDDLFTIYVKAEEVREAVRKADHGR